MIKIVLFIVLLLVYNFLKIPVIFKKKNLKIGPLCLTLFFIFKVQTGRVVFVVAISYIMAIAKEDLLIQSKHILENITLFLGLNR